MKLAIKYLADKVSSQQDCKETLSDRKKTACQHLCHKISVHGQGVVDPVKIFSACGLITMHNLAAVCDTVWVYEFPKNLEALRRCPLDRDYVRLQKHAFPTRVTVLNLVTLGQTVCP